MIKTGDIAIRFGLHADTVRDWIDMFEDFFSLGARRGTSTQRTFTEQDEILINTISELRKQRIDFEAIRARLANGERLSMLPLVNEPVPPESALAVYQKVTRLEIEHDNALQEIERLRREGREKEKAAQERIEDLLQQVAVLRYQLSQAADKDG